jgi:hypothetical protein
MKVLNKYHFSKWPENAVSIMRPGPLGNPFIIGRDGERDVVCDKHLNWARHKINTDSSFKDLVRSLKGKDLVCVCAPKRCHGNNYIILCEEIDDEDQVQSGRSA